MAEEKDGSVIYQHPQSKLFSKMAGLVRLKTPVPALPADPVAVLDRKLEHEDRRLKKDNRRWRAVIYLTVTVCLIIFGLVLAQVITSVTSSSGHLPNIDVSEQKAASVAVPRHEPLVAGMSSADRQTAVDKAPKEAVVAAANGGTEEIVLTMTNGRPEDDYVLSIAETGRGNNLDITMKKEGENADGQAARQAAEESREVHVGLAEEEPQALAFGPEGRSGYVAYVPVPLGGEERKTDTPTTTTTTTTPRPLPPVVRNRPFFVPVMFQERRVPPPFRRPSPPFQRPPAPVMTPPRPPVRQPHRLPTRPTPNQRPLFQGRPLPSLPPTSRQPLFQGRPVISLPPTNQRPPFQGQTPTGLPLANQGRPLQGQTPRPQLAVFLQRPTGLPPNFNLQQNSNVQQTARPIGPLPLDNEDPFAGRMGSLLRNMRQLMSTMRPLLIVEPTLPSNMSLSRLLGPRGPFGPPRPVPRRPLVPQTRGFPPQPPPAGLRPGPFRPPISVAPPLQATNQRVFAPRPTNQRPFPPRPLPAPAQSANQRVFNQQRNFVPPPRPVLHAPSENPSQRFPSQPSQTVTLVGNPQYNYPSTATGIQDILRYIQGEYRPQNGHGAYNGLRQQQQAGLNPNSPYSSRGVSSNRFDSNGFGNNNNNNGFSSGGFGGSGSHSGGGRRQDGPIYPPGYQGQRFSLGSSRQPYRLMLDVYPMENSDRYERPAARSGGYEPTMAQSVVYELPVARSSRYEPLVAMSSRYEPLVARSGRYDPLMAMSSMYEPLVARSGRYEPTMAIPVRYEPSVAKSVRYEPTVAIPVRYQPAMASSVKYEPTMARPVRYEPTTERSFRYEPLVGNSIRYQPSHPASLRYEPLMASPIRHEPTMPKLPRHEPMMAKSVYEPAMARSVRYEYWLPMREAMLV